MSGAVEEVDRDAPLFDQSVPVRIHSSEREDRVGALTVRLLSGSKVRPSTSLPLLRGGVVFLLWSQPRARTFRLAGSPSLPCTLRPKKNSDTFTLPFTLHRCDWAFPCGVLGCCSCLLTCCLASHRAPLIPVLAVLVEKRAEGSAVAPRADRPGRLLLPVLLGRCRGGVSRAEAGPGEQHAWLRPPPVPRPRSRPRGASLQLILASPPAR